MSTHPEQAQMEAPLSGRWHRGGGNLCCGSLRIARADFDTSPSDAVQAEVLDWIVTTLNAALRPQAAPAPQPEAAEPVAAPVQPVAAPDLGPWTVSADGKCISSDDFEHDVLLRVSGDFACEADRIAYAQDIARRLAHE